MTRIGKTFVLALSLSLLAACASAVPSERGWIGGRFQSVSRDAVVELTQPETGRTILGMPEGVSADTGALLTAAYDGSPVGRAGLAEGDLVFALDGAPVKDVPDLRERVEALPPGSRASVAYWRSGETRTADVVVGRELYESAGTINIGLPLTFNLDLWPFDGGISVLGLVSVRWDDDRNDLDGPVDDYRRTVEPAEEVRGPQQESFGVFIVPFGMSRGVRVLRQETLP